MEITSNNFWNGINVGDYNMQIIMEQSCSTLEEIGKITTSENFKFKDLEQKLTEYFSKYEKILVKVRYRYLNKRIKTFEKLGYKIQNTTLYDNTTASTDCMYAVLTR